MKNFAILVLALALYGACVPTEKDLSDYPRPSREQRGPDGNGQSADSVPARITRDVFACVVKVPAGYDWRQDSLFGNVNCALTLLKNGNPVMDLKAGKGTDIPINPGMHHIAEGRLYTEGRGVVKRDGIDFYRFEGNENIVSIFPDSTGTYTLSAVAGGGFCFRKDGEQLLRMSGGNPKSLYKDRGHIYFSYLTKTPEGTELDIVEDGEPSKVDAPEGTQILAARMLQGKQYMLYVKNGYYFISDGRKEIKHCFCQPAEYEDAELFPFAGGCGALIDKIFAQKSKSDRILLTGSRGVAYIPTGKAAYVRMNPDCRWAEVIWDRDGTIRACCSDTIIYHVDRKSFLPTGDCVWYGCGDLVFGAGDIETGRPYLWDNGRITEIDVFGYVSAVGVSLSK